MRPTFGGIKSCATNALKGRWAEAVIASASLVSVSLLNSFLQAILMQIFKVDAIWTFYSPTALPQYNTVASVCISLFSALFSLLIVFPFFFGILRWFWLICGGKDADLDNIFYYFSKPKLFFKALAVAFGLLWRVTVGAVICFLPFFAAEILSSPVMYAHFGITMPIWLSGMYSIKSAIMLFCLCLFILWILRYSLFYAAAFDNPDMSVNRIFRRSAEMTRGALLRFFAFVLSFIGWYFISFLILPLVFVVPFLLASFSVYGHCECSYYSGKTAAK